MSKKSLLLLLAGIFSLVQIKIIGYIGISELVFVFAAPVLLFKNQKLLNKHGFKWVLLLAGLWLLNGVITDWYRHNTFENAIKGFAATYCVLTTLIVLHNLLWDDVWRIRWFAFGVAISVVLSIYVFPSGVAVEKAFEEGIASLDAAQDYKLAFLSVITSLAMVPVIFFYIKIPGVSVLIASCLSIFSLLQGGRSVFLIYLMTIGLMMLVNNNPVRMARINRAFYVLAVVLILLGTMASTVYKKVVSSGAMGEDELNKYEMQSHSKIGLLSGRSEFVGAVLAIKDSPILGFGSAARDWGGYNDRAALLIGNEELPDLSQVPYMPGHSQIFGSWVNSGIFGGIFWIYILKILYRTLKYNMAVVPKLFGYLSLTIPGMMWNIIFSPLGSRIISAAPIAVFLLLEHYRLSGKMRQYDGLPRRTK